MAEWNAFLKEYVDACPSSYFVLGLGYANEGNLGELFAVADADGSDEATQWTFLYADPHTVEIDGAQTTMDEPAHLKTVISQVETGSTSFPRFVYLGAQKYQVTQTDVEDVDGQKFVTIMLAGPGRGGAIVKGATYFAVGLFEDKREQNKGSCRNDTFKVAQAANNC